MRTGAIICEYNPFHNGHKYQLEKLKSDLNLDRIICLMSGDFMQRGEPSLYSKETRTKLALENGADLVLLLPLAYATGSADLFAYGAVSILNRLNCVDFLCFGSECGDINLLTKCAKDLMISGSISCDGIQKLMKEGNTFAKARALLFPEYEEILSRPNNVLALEYITALKETNSTISPYTISRKGEAYDDDSINQSEPLLSASAIRKAVMSGNADAVRNSVPYTFSDISDRPLCIDDFSDEIFNALISIGMNAESILDYSEDLYNKIKNSLYGFKTASDFIEKIKTKNYTYARISRFITHILLSVLGTGNELKNDAGEISHIRILGFKKDSSDLLKVISEKGSIKAVSGISDAYNEMNTITKYFTELEIKAAAVYDRHSGNCVHEFSKPVIVY